MNFSKLSFAIIVIGSAMIIGALAWWGISFEFRLDAFKCFFQKSYICNIREYEPIVLYIGLGILSLGVILKYSMSNSQNEVSNVSAQSKIEIEPEGASNNKIQQPNISVKMFSNSFRRLLLVCGALYIGITISNLSFMIEQSDTVFSFGYYLRIVADALTAIFFILFFSNTSKK